MNENIGRIENLVDKPLSEIEKNILNVINNKLENEIGDADIYTDYLEIGVDSITFIQIIVELESIYDFEFEDSMIIMDENNSNIKTLIDYVESQIQKKDLGQ